MASSASCPRVSARSFSSATTRSRGGPPARRPPPAGKRPAVALEARCNGRGKPAVVRALEILLVQPAQLLGIELRGRAADVPKVEPVNELLRREQFRVAVG